MSLQIPHRITVHVIAHNGISHTVELHIHVIVFQKLRIGSLHAQRIQRIDILAIYFPFAFQILIYPQGHRLQDTSCRRYADVLKSPSDPLLQLCLDFFYGAAHFINIVNLPVQHGPRLVLPDTLRYHMKFTARAVSHCSHDASCPDIQTKH